MGERTTSYSRKFAQGSLFDETLVRPSLSDDSTAYHISEMSHEALVVWRTAIAKYQERERNTISTRQASLFDLATTHCDPDAIDPFVLKFYPAEFYRLPADGKGDACIYFVLDRALPAILYVGETSRSHKRWQGIHDCKRYLLNYRDLHATHNLGVQIVMGFWWDTPVGDRARRDLEAQLIAKWKSPFNKENWQYWNTPFTGGKSL